jgi:hypothetical protein
VAETTEDNTDEATASRQAVSRGVRFISCDVRVSGLSIPLTPEVEAATGGPHLTLELRTDMWPFWLDEAVDAAVAADSAAKRLSAVYEQFEAGDATEDDFDPFLFRELRATMRGRGAGTRRRVRRRLLRPSSTTCALTRSP